MHNHNTRLIKPVLRISLVLVIAFTFVTLVVRLLSAQGPANLTRITTASSTVRESRNPSVSADGTVIAFQSDSDFLGQGILDSQFEIWVYDTKTMTYTRVTTASDGATRDSYDPSLSADGRYVAFRSDSDFLDQNILDDQYEIWFYDLETKALTRVTTASDGATRDSSDANLNADGSVLAFHSDSDFFGQNILDNQNEVWLYDVVGMTYTRVTTASSSTKDSMDPFLSADGSIVAFESTSDLLGLGNVIAQEIWLYDTTTMTYTRVTTATPGDRDCYNPSLNAAGTVIAFATDADYFSQNIPQYQFEVWLYDTAAMTLTRVTYASDSNRASDRTTLSADGSLVAFQSDSDFLGDGIPDGQFEVWLYNTVTMTYTRVTIGSDQDRDSLRPSLSADGAVLAFHSDSDLLGEGIPNSREEIWLARFGYRVYLPLVLK